MSISRLPAYLQHAASAPESPEQQQHTPPAVELRCAPACIASGCPFCCTQISPVAHQCLGPTAESLPAAVLLAAAWQLPQQQQPAVSCNTQHCCLRKLHTCRQQQLHANHHPSMAATLMLQADQLELAVHCLYAKIAN